MRQRHEMPERTQQWCSVHRIGHDLTGPRCPEWQAALDRREATIGLRRERWQRERDRKRRYRPCLSCRRTFDAGPPRAGRPIETCSPGCAKARKDHQQRLRRLGIPLRYPKLTYGLRPRDAEPQWSPEAVSFLAAFDDGDQTWGTINPAKLEAEIAEDERWQRWRNAREVAEVEAHLAAGKMSREVYDAWRCLYEAAQADQVKHLPTE